LDSLRGRTPTFSSRRADTSFKISKNCVGLVLLNRGIGRSRLVMSEKRVLVPLTDEREDGREDEVGVYEKGRECEEREDELPVTFE
jgi:hypothetical protein